MIGVEVGNKDYVNLVQCDLVRLEGDKRRSAAVDQEVGLPAGYVEAGVESASTSERVTASDELYLHDFFQATLASRKLGASGKVFSLCFPSHQVYGNADQGEEGDDQPSLKSRRKQEFRPTRHLGEVIQNESADEDAANGLHQHRRPHRIGQNPDLAIDERMVRSLF
jgi:hypothetical protein